MWILVGVAGTLIWVSIVDIPSLLKTKRRTPVWAVGCLTLFICSLCLMYALHIPMPNPLDWVTAAMRPIQFNKFG